MRPTRRITLLLTVLCMALTAAGGAAAAQHQLSRQVVLEHARRHVKHTGRRRSDRHAKRHRKTTKRKRRTGGGEGNYWLISSTGQVFAYGQARKYGRDRGVGGIRGTVEGIKGTPNGRGYWLVSSRGHYAHGDADRYPYRGGGLRAYHVHEKPRGLKGRIVGYAETDLDGPAPAAKTDTTKTTPAPPAPTPAPAPVPTPAPPAGPPPIVCDGNINTSIPSTATAGVWYSAQLSATGDEGTGWSWRITSGSLPAGITLNQATGLISGFPTGQSFYTQVQLEATPNDGGACRALDGQAGISVNAAPPAPQLTLNTSSVPTGEVGVNYPVQQLHATGGDGNYAWSATSLPAGMSLTTSGVLSGTPTTAATGYQASFNVTVTDPTDSSWQPVTGGVSFTVNWPPVQITGPSSLTGGQATVAYAGAQFTAEGGDGAESPTSPVTGGYSYTWSATGLPNGLSLASSGALTGTPTAAGTFHVDVTVDAGSGNSYSETITLTITDAPLRFLTTTLTAIQGQSYSGQIQATGGQAPYSYALVGGSLPQGLSFNDGQITGTPTQATSGTSVDTISIAVTDSQAPAWQATESLTVWVAPSMVTPDTSVSGTSTSGIWGGYVEQATSAFTSVSGTFTVPTVEAAGPTNSVTPWVGIDGFGTNNLIQAGVSATANVGNGAAVSYEAWWTTVGPIGSPQNRPNDYEFDAAPGDSISVAIWQTSAGYWEITLNDCTSGQGFATNVSYAGTDDTAEWIVETPSGSGPVGYSATSDFTQMFSSAMGTGLTSQPSPGVTLSTPSASGFTVTDNN